mgnify:CR=1 FL=1
MMIRSVAVLACLITAAVMGYFIRDINRRFPNTSVCEQYTKDSPAMLDGLEITPLSTHIYSYDEYRERYPDSLDAGEHAKDWKVIVYKLAFCNTTEKELRFEADSFLAVAQNSGFHNGVSKSDDTARRGAGDRIVVYCNGDSYREKVVSKIRGGDVHAGLLVVSGTKRTGVYQ